MTNPNWPGGGQPQDQPPYGGQPPYGQPTQGQPTQGQPTQGQPPHGQPPYGGQQYPEQQYPQQPGSEQPGSQYGPPQGQPQYGPPQGQPAYGQPAYGQPAYGQPPAGAPGQGQPQYGYPQQPGYPPQPGYGPPQGAGGYPPYGPPRRSRMPWLVAGGLAVVLAAGLVLWLTVFSADKASNPQAAARTYLEAAKKHDVGAAKAVACKEDQEALAKNASEEFIPNDVVLTSYTITGQHEAGGGVTIVDGSVTIKAEGETNTVPLDLPVVKEDGSFKVCNAKDDAATATVTPAPTG